MNVGSILNNDSPPSDHEKEPKQAVSSGRIAGESQSAHQRHSITNILNDTPSVTPEEPQTFVKPVVNANNSSSPPVQSSPITPRAVPIKRNSIANITNDRDVDITTGKETSFNISRQANSNNHHQNNHKIEQVDELTKIQQLKKSTKPKRYATPPIWAQEYIPPNKAHLVDHSEVENHNGSHVRTALSDKPVFDYTTTRSVDLQCSITGIIPPPSITRTMAEWIFANFSNINDKNRKFVELELKFGKIIDKRTGSRINLNVITECIFTDHSSVHFDMQVEEIAWNEIRKFLEELEKGYQEELRNSIGKDKPKRKFNTLDSDITDTFYQTGGKGEHIRKIRVSKDNNLTPPRFTAIEKERIADLYIHNPSSMYDLRLSLSLEMPVPEGNVEAIIAKNKASLVREKKRNTWTHAPTITQFDLTRVLIPHEAKNKHGKKIVNHDIHFEVEMEIDTPEVFNAIDKITSGTDTFRLEELVEVFVNNARVLNNRVTKLALP
ncbi:CYTH-like domain-containing protein [Scheffersomyces xylosifermentans]|uniref:CYTH-like domain-containing protein n=1 Tax=Scheffersomyces xylosifermentans TaxID=1304137 RepID=UPI00315DA7BF